MAPDLGTEADTRGKPSFWRAFRHQARGPEGLALFVALAVAFIPTPWSLPRGPWLIVNVVVIAIVMAAIMARLTGYRPATEHEHQAVVSGPPLWHRTRADVAVGEAIRLDLAHCTRMSRMWRRDRVAIPRRAIYLSREVLSPTEARANGVHKAGPLLRVDPSQIPPGTLYLRPTGEIAVTTTLEARREK